MARRPVPVGKLVDMVCDDGSDYDDARFGWESGKLENGVLTLQFERDPEVEADDYDNDFETTSHQFVSRDRLLGLLSDFLGPDDVTMVETELFGQQQ
jgi:hypothetical protein